MKMRTVYNSYFVKQTKKLRSRGDDHFQTELWSNSPNIYTF